MSVREAASTAARWLRERLAALTWVHRSLLVGALLTLGWMHWMEPGFRNRIVWDGLFMLVGPLVLAITHREHIGWNVNRRAIRNTILLSLFVVPFYVVGSTMPSIRRFYPMWETSTSPEAFVPHALGLFFLALATETYYRGLLCVGVKDLGFKAVFISPLLYMFHHRGKPWVEFLLSGPTDVLFGAVDYKSDSILPSVVAHGAGLVLLDWLVMHDPLWPETVTVAYLEWLPFPI